MADTNHTLCSVEGCVRKSKARGYCSQHYSIARKLELKNGAAPCIITPRKISKCRSCGISFKPKTSVRTEFCSRQCCFDAKAITPSSIVYAGFCNGCGKAFVSKRKKLYCCEECRPVLAAHPKNSVKMAAQPCATCGKPCGYVFGRARIYCSKECAHQSDAHKESKRAAKAKRRARLKFVFVETVKPFNVFDRDGWRCQLCGCKTPKSRRNTIFDNAPELDHIIPISKGGDHSYLNTQCACRKCNGLKSDTPRGQMLMFG